jgi:hypothetical protein
MADPQPGPVPAPAPDATAFEISITATPDRIWEDVTDPVRRAAFSFTVRVSSSSGGWPMIRTGLETLAATGELLTTPDSSKTPTTGTAEDRRSRQPRRPCYRALSESQSPMNPRKCPRNSSCSCGG